MALSNVACILKEGPLKGRGVLMIDWDLEAPGLHMFFHTESSSQNEDITDSYVEHEYRPGLIDLFIELKKVGSDSSLVEPYAKARYA
jgi:hypothetical protein